MKMKLRDMREDKDLTQQEVAQYLRCDQSLYSKYERGERDVPLHIMVALAGLYLGSRACPGFLLLLFFFQALLS